MRAIPIPVETGTGLSCVCRARTPRALVSSALPGALGSEHKSQRFVGTSHRHAGHGADVTHDITTKSEFQSNTQPRPR